MRSGVGRAVWDERRRDAWRETCSGVMSGSAKRDPNRLN